MRDGATTPSAPPPQRLLPASALDLRSHDELAVLRAVCWVGVERRSATGARKPEVRRQIAMRRAPLRRHLKQLTNVGALTVGGSWLHRTYSLTDAALATLLAAEDEQASSLADSGG